METDNQELHNFLQDVIANVYRGDPVKSLQAIALDALLLAQKIDYARSNAEFSGEGKRSLTDSAGTPG